MEVSIWGRREHEPQATNRLVRKFESMGRRRTDLPDGFETRFWKLIILLNIGPIALAFGLLLAFFRGTSRFVWASLAVSAVAFLFAGRTYLIARRQIEKSTEE
ncbi:MAG: hypothetical protein U5J64_09600 [Halobacteriales archaeon]|nr:hypothetical protein [Halobacteriales archaeon]